MWDEHSPMHSDGGYSPSYGTPDYGTSGGGINCDPNTFVVEPRTPKWVMICGVVITTVNVLLLICSACLLLAAQSMTTALHLAGTLGDHAIQLFWGVSCWGFFLALLGIFGGVTRRRCGLWVYLVFLVLTVLLFLSVGVAILLVNGSINTGSQWKNTAEGAWKKMVSEKGGKGNTACEVEASFSCSGFDSQTPGKGCCIPGVCYSKITPPSWVNDFCPSDCPSNTQSSQTCYSVLRSWVKGNMIWCCVVAFGAAALSLVLLLLCVFLLRANKRPRRVVYQRID